MAHIRTYARLKPSKKAYAGYEINKNMLKIHIPECKDILSIDSHQSFRSSLSYEVVFTEVFKPNATQEDVFDVSAKEIIQGFLNGYNGTLFTYGQTGTGKTYTVEGNTAHYGSRGLSTRALSMIYQELENRLDVHISVYLSYLEIYQEIAYDLLNPSSRSSIPIIPFAKVTVFEGPQDSCILRGLSLHLAANEEIAQMLLLQGQANRKVAETPVNQRSSRSHAVFTVYLQVCKLDTKVMVNSKLHLVDLAGSERVSKTGVDGQQLTEAKSINLSLHHLETVIIALQTERPSGLEDRSKGECTPIPGQSSISIISCPSSDSGSRPIKFVPYRNSLLTMVLKDSLGGNCLTAMIATISMESENVGESISTCRFAQRVARISNNARRNEEIDDKTLIKRLKKKVAFLKREVATLKSQGKNISPVIFEKNSLPLSEQDKTACAKIMEGFLLGIISNPINAGIYDHYHFLECLHLLKQQCLRASTSPSPLQNSQQQQSQQLQMSAVQSSDTIVRIQPNIPHQVGADSNLSDVSHASEIKIGSQQQHIEVTYSDLSMGTSEEFYSASENQEGSVVYRAKSLALEKRNTELKNLQKTSNGEYCMSSIERVKLSDIRCVNPKPPLLKDSLKPVKPEQVKQNIYMQRLQATECNLRHKLKVLNVQIVDQHIHMLHLKSNLASPMQITKEQLVQQHQLKVQAKFNEKLYNLLEKKDKLQQALSPERERGPLYRYNRMLLKAKQAQKEEKCPLSVKQGNGVTGSPERQQQMESRKQDKNVLSLKAKQIFVKEIVAKETLKHLKKQHRTCEQHVNDNHGINIKTIQSSPDSVHTLKESDIVNSGYVNQLEDKTAAIKSPQCSKMKCQSSKFSSISGTWSKDLSSSEASQNTEKQVKSLEIDLIIDNAERNKSQ